MNSDMRRGRAEIEGLTSLTPLTDAARQVIGARLKAVESRLGPAAGERGATDLPAPQHLHRLRVATRRAAAALDVYRTCLRSKDRKRVKAVLRDIRRAAAAGRDLDVFASMVARWSARVSSTDETRAALPWLSGRIAERRREAQRRLIEVGEEHDPRRLARLRRGVLKRLCEPGARDFDRSDASSGRVLLAHAASATLGAALERLRAAAEADLGVLDRLHEVRIAVKKVRYAAELFTPCLPAPALRDLLPRLEEMQELLGAVNDSHQFLGFLQGERDAIDADAGPDAGADGAGAPSPGGRIAEARGSLEALIRRVDAQRHDRAAGFVEWWQHFAAGEFYAGFEAALAEAAASAPSSEAGSIYDETAPARPHAALPPGAPIGALIGGETPDEAANAHGESGKPWRLAAIDVGTNSIRLIVAEAYGEGNYRILDDERELARLGRGLAASGELSDDAMALAATAIAHFRRIAEGYGAQRIRVVGTAAVREASNGERFIALVRERAGLLMETISAEQEARLAFLSAAHAFDLRSIPTAVVDVGGGSTEIVLSQGGVVEQVFTLPLGAVRLTEAFGGPEQSSGERFEEMRDAIRRTVGEHIGRPAVEPELIVGSGGTFETLAKIAMAIEEGSRAQTATVRGFDMRRKEVREILDWLRSLPLAKRVRVPGLSPQRAEIMVAGVAIVHTVMKELAVKRMRAHDGGIRDGLLLQMTKEFFAGGADAAGGPGSEARAKMRAVRHFAAACNYERKHCYHVAGLALQIFDQLVRDDRAPEGEWRTADGRALLEAAAVLHDCGYHITYSKHHLHSAHLITHSDMPSFSRRELEIVANIARYHRGQEPKTSHEDFARLDKRDRETVRLLGAILRVADGLDRTHVQNVRRVAVRWPREGDDAGTLTLVIDAPADPAVDIWGSARKAGLFEREFGVEPRYLWSQSPRAAGSAPPVPERAGQPLPVRGANGALRAERD